VFKGKISTIVECRVDLSHRIALVSFHSGGEPALKPIHIVFVLLLVIASITVFIFMSEPPIGAAGVAHESIQGMSVGGDGAARLSSIGKAPFYFQAAVILMAVALLYMGVAEHRRDTRFRVFMVLGAAFALFVWYNLYSSYEAYLATGETEILFGFPVPTNWMLWGVWGSFVLFDLFFVFFFRDYFWPPEDEAAFKALVEEMKNKEKTGDA